jgi:hypothetical protein
MKPLRILALLILLPCALGSADLAPVSDAELIDAIDATTMLGRIARGTWEWKS